MATRVEAEFLEGKQVVFTARGRAQVNARATLDDGPIGFTSGELLLIALANCSLGVLTGHDLLKDVPLRRCRAILEAEPAEKPYRYQDIKVVIEVDVDDPALLERRAALERVADRCPIGNTLRALPTINLELRLNVPGQTAATRAAGE